MRTVSQLLDTYSESPLNARAFLVLALETFFIAIVLYSRFKLSASEYAKNNWVYVFAINGTEDLCISMLYIGENFAYTGSVLKRLINLHS